MKLTDKTDYSLRVIIYLLKNPGWAKVQKIADYYNISRNHLRVVVNDLSRLKLIETTPGPQGGITLSRRAGDFSIGELIKKTESLELVECFNKKNNECRIIGTCKLKPLLKQAQDAFFEVLMDYKIDSLK